MQPITPCLWFDHQAEEAAEFYTSIFGLDHGTGHLAAMNSQKNQRINDGTG